VVAGAGFETIDSGIERLLLTPEDSSIQPLNQTVRPISARSSNSPVQEECSQCSSSANSPLISDAYVLMNIRQSISLLDAGSLGGVRTVLEMLVQLLGARSEGREG